MRRALLCLTAAPAILLADGDLYRELLLADRPAAYWRFDQIEECCTPNETHEALRANAGGNVSLLEEGPRPPQFPNFVPENTAADFTHFPSEAFLRVRDPGPLSEFDFTNGQTITLEAWVYCLQLKDGQTVAVVGKGRTGAPGFVKDNQNWALHLRGCGEAACVSFAFHDAKNAGDAGWHRWTTTKGFRAGPGWQHIAVTYTFGDPASVRGYINGESLPGAWDLGGATKEAPVVDDDEVWIGGALGGVAELQFPGRIDELAIYREPLPPERVKAHAGRAVAAPELVGGG